MTLRPSVKYGGGSIMDWDCIFTSEATIKAQLWHLLLLLAVQKVINKTEFSLP